MGGVPVLGGRAVSEVVGTGPRQVKLSGQVEVRRKGVRGLLEKPDGPEVCVPRAQGGHSHGHDRADRGCSISDKESRTRLRGWRGLSGKGIEGTVDEHLLRCVSIRGRESSEGHEHEGKGQV
jgi:hypothetical protein